MKPDEITKVWAEGMKAAEEFGQLTEQFDKVVYASGFMRGYELGKYNPFREKKEEG